MRRPLIAFAVACLLFGSIVTTPSIAAGCADGTAQCPITEHDAEKPVLHSELDAAIHGYLLAHPEVLIEVQKALQTKQAEERGAKSKAAIVENRAALVADSRDFELGNPKGDVTIVEFFDNQCPYCKLLAPALDQLIASDPNLRIVLKEFPILGPGSEVAARYALAVKRQGKYAEFHAALLADKTAEGQLAEPRLLEIATSLGLNLDRLKTDAASPEIMNQIQHTRALGRLIGVTGTPGLVIGNTVESGLMPLDALTAAVHMARAPA